MDYSGRRGVKRLRLDNLDFKEITADVVNAGVVNTTDLNADGTINAQFIRAFACFCDGIRATSLAVGDPDGVNAIYTFPFNAPLDTQVITANAVGGLEWKTPAEASSKTLFIQTVTKTNLASDLEAECTTSGPGSRLIPANSMSVGDVYEFTLSGVITLFGASSITFRVRGGSAVLAPTLRPLVIEDTFVLAPLTDNVAFSYTVRFVVRTIGVGASMLGTATLNVDGFPARVGNSLFSTLDTLNDNVFDVTSEFNLPEVGSNVSVRLLEFLRSRVL